MFIRLGKLSDYFPSPFAHDAASASAYDETIPPDTSFISMDRNGGKNYIYHLVNSFCDPPAGVNLMEDQYFNVVGVRDMASALYNDVIEYEDVSDGQGCLHLPCVGHLS